MWPFLPCDLDYLYKLFTPSQGGFTLIEKNIFEHNGHIHEFSTGRQPNGEIYFQNYNYSVNLFLCCKFSSLNDLIIYFPIQMYRQPNLTMP